MLARISIIEKLIIALDNATSGILSELSLL